MSRKALKKVKLKAETENPNGFLFNYKMKTKSLLLLILRGSNIERNILNTLLYICPNICCLFLLLLTNRNSFSATEQIPDVVAIYLTSGKF